MSKYFDLHVEYKIIYSRIFDEYIKIKILSKTQVFTYFQETEITCAYHFSEPESYELCMYPTSNSWTRLYQPSGYYVHTDDSGDSRMLCLNMEPSCTIAMFASDRTRPGIVVYVAFSYLCSFRLCELCCIIL